MLVRYLRLASQRYRGQVAGIAALAVLALAVVGYGEQNPQLSMSDRLYAGVQLFLMSGDVNKPPTPLPLEIARWLAPLTVSYIAFRTISALFLRQYTQARIRIFFRHHVIICGLGQIGLRFATGFHQRGDRVVVIDQTPPAAAVEKCRELGIPVLTGDATAWNTLSQAEVRRARYLIAVCGQDVVNAEVALALMMSSTRRQRRIDSLIQLTDERLCQLVTQEAFAGTAPGPIVCEFFNVYHAGPAALFDTHADLVIAQEGSPPHLVILGAGRFVIALFIEAARRWRLNRQQPTARIRITLVTPDAGTQAAALSARYPALATTCELKAYPIDPSNPEGPPLLPPDTDQADQPTGALVCLDEDAATFRATLLIRRLLPEEYPVIACTTGRSSLADLLDRSMSGMLTNVKGFSLLDRVCRPEVLLNGRKESLAQAIHADYVRRRIKDGANPNDPALAVWEALPESLRASNRAQAADLGEKLRVIGCELIPRIDWDAPPLPFTQSEVEYLAVLEHQRWQAERRQNGWHQAPFRDPFRKLSPYLVPWENLPEEIKDLDRDAIRVLPTFLARAGFAIARRTPPRPSGNAPNGPGDTVAPENP
ncbi:MAG TPA: NAD-binding protein [Pseudonocardiaceae bacterium]